MALFEYRAIDKAGKTKKGKIDAASEKQASVKIRSQGLHPISINSSKGKSAAKPKSKKQLYKASIPSKVITGFSRQLSVLVSTGIPYDKALEILIEECEHQGFQHVLSDIKAQIVEGSSLAAALQKHGEHFPKMYIAMVRAGEAGGTLGRVLSQLTESREENEELVAKIQSALIYPVIMAVMGIGIVGFMITFIIPKIVPIFQQFDIELPLPTRIVLGTSNFVVANWIPLLILILLTTLFGYRFSKSKTGEKLLDALLLKLPIIGNMIRRIVVFRFTETLGTLLVSGVELAQSMEIVKYVVGNRVFEDKFDEILSNITQKGMDLSHALRKSEEFPLTVIQMIRVGEESSKLDEMLTKISTIQKKEVNQSFDKTVALLEPVMILGMAFMVGFIVLAVMLPMFKMNQLL